MSVDGILLVDKPKGWTSYDVVAKVRNILKNEAGQKVKVGHTGTLDPLASGLLVLMVGSYCKRAGEFSKLDKTYEATMKLGETSTTGDAEGEKIKISDIEPKSVSIKNAIAIFLNTFEQTPPAYSAVKVGGRRAYKLARGGKKVELEPRKVTVHSLELAEYSYPLVKFTAHVSSGTYIRSLAEDIGKKLGTGAYITELRRTAVDKFEVKKSVQPQEASIDKIIKV